MEEPGGLPFEREYFVHLSDCDADLCLSVRGFLRWFEEIALLQSEELGVGIDHYHEHQVIWMLSRYDLELADRPAFRERVTVGTRPLDYRGILANRRFWVRGGDGASLVRGLSQWVHVDTRRMRPVRVPAETARAYRMAESGTRLPVPGEPGPPDREDHVAEFTVRRGDTDVNGHLNNVRYVEWALHTLPGEVVRGRAIRRLLVHFRSETLPGARVRSVARVDPADAGLRTRHALVEGDRIAGLVEARWA
jgi:medium-chain acyl-[acyl-carrier-protein] hydrolase